MPNPPDLPSLIGQQLSSVHVVPGDIGLQFSRYPLVMPGHKFSDSATIGIEHGFRVGSLEDSTLCLQRHGLREFCVEAGLLLRLIQRVVLAAEETVDGDILLTFDDGTYLKILESDEGFEGFHLDFQKQTSI